MAILTGQGNHLREEGTVVFAKSATILSAAQNGSQQPKFKPWWRQVEALGTVQWRPLAGAGEGI